MQTEYIEKKTSWLAILSLLCGVGVVFCCVFCFLWSSGWFIVGMGWLHRIGPALAFISIVWITIRRRFTKGYILAFVAIILCLPTIILEIGIRESVKVREKRKREWTGLYNLELLGKNLIEYANDNDGHLPDANRWCDLLMEHNKELTKENFRHPQPERFRDIFNFEGDIQFAFNKNLSGLKLSEVSPGAVLLWESDGDWNLNGGQELLELRRNEEWAIAVLFVDGTILNYWYDKKALRTFDEHGKHMYYVKPRWNP